MSEAASADQQHELSAHTTVLAAAMRLCDLGERKGLPEFSPLEASTMTEILPRRTRLPLPGMGLKPLAEAADSTIDENITSSPPSRSLRRMSVISVGLSRAELVALKETIELTPRFDGRAEVRDAIQNTLHQRSLRPAPLSVEKSALSELARRIIPIDVPTATIRSKLNRELQRAQVAS